MREIFKSSSLMATNGRLRKYPWHDIGIDQSFAVAHNEIKKGSLTTLAYRTGKRIGKKFRVIDHGDKHGYEVACIEVKALEAKPIGWNNDMNKAVDK